MAFNAPHTPFHEPPASLEPASGGGYTNPALTDNLSLYVRMQEALDTEIGRLLASVDQANTNIIIVGDNGTPAQVVQPPFGPTGGGGTQVEDCATQLDNAIANVDAPPATVAADVERVVQSCGPEIAEDFAGYVKIWHNTAIKTKDRVSIAGSHCPKTAM